MPKIVQDNMAKSATPPKPEPFYKLVQVGNEIDLVACDATGKSYPTGIVLTIDGTGKIYRRALPDSIQYHVPRDAQKRIIMT